VPFVKSCDRDVFWFARILLTDTELLSTCFEQWNYVVLAPDTCPCMMQTKYFTRGALIIIVKVSRVMYLQNEGNLAEANQA